MRIAFNPSTVAALTTPPNNKDITFDLRGQNIFARGVKFYGTDTNTWRDIKVNNVSIGSHTLDLRNGSNTTLTNTNGVVTINSTWRPVVDSLTSDSATSSLSANQGRVLAGLINGKSDSDHNHDSRYLKLTGGTMTGIIRFNNLINNDSAIVLDYKYSASGFARDIVSMKNSIYEDANLGSLSVLCYPNSTSNGFAYIYLGTGTYDALNNLRIYKDRVTFGNNILIDTGNISSQTVANAYHLRINSANSWSTWNWVGQGNQPNWLWGSNDGTNMYVWNPSNFSVKYATTSSYLTNGFSAAFVNKWDCNAPDRVVYSDYGSSGRSVTNAPSGWNYGTLLELGHTNYRGLNGQLNIQLMWDVAHNTANPGTLWFRGKDSIKGWAKSWAKVITDQNISSILSNYYTKSETDGKYVTLTTTQTIGGSKTFTTGIKFNVNNNGDANLGPGDGFKLFYNETSGSNFPGYYYNVASFMTGYTGFQLACYGGSDQYLKYRHRQDNGTWHPWNTLAFTTDIPSSLKNPHALTISLNGASQGPYDGSAAKSINITAASVGAAISGHNHDDRYLRLAGGTMQLGEGLKFHADDNYFGTYSDARIISLLDANDTICAGGLIIDERATLNGKEYVTELLRIRDSEFKWRGADILHSGNYSGILDSRYYTESEVNSLLSNKLNTSNFNWTNLPGKIVAGNEFNIVNAGFTEGIWFNYLPINDRSNPATINGYHFGNGNKGYTYIVASGFVKNGSNSSYVLLGDGGHQTISSLSVNYANSAGNASTLGGTSLGGLFTAFGNNGHNITATIGGVTKSFLVNYAADADKVDGVHITWAGALTSTAHLVAWEDDGSALRDINPANVTVGNSDKVDGYHASQLAKAWSGSGTMNQVAQNNGNYFGMITGTGTEGFPNDDGGWTHVFQASYNNNSGGDGNKGNFWITQIANRAGTTSPWIRSRSGGSDITTGWTDWVRIMTKNDVDNYYWANNQITTSPKINAQVRVSSLGAGCLTNIANTVMATNWLRATGSTGIYFQDHAGGLYMSDDTWIRTYNNKAIMAKGYAHSSHNSDDAMLLAGGGWKKLSTLVEYPSDESSKLVKKISDAYELRFVKLVNFNNLIYVDGWIRADANGKSFTLDAKFKPYLYNNDRDLPTIVQMGWDDSITIDGDGHVSIHIEGGRKKRIGFFYTGRA